MKPNAAIFLGLAATVASTVAWHGPGGAGVSLVNGIERETRAMLDNYEMSVVKVTAQRQPMARRIILSGPGDDFQRAEIVRYSERIAGVGEARWSVTRSHFRHPLPLLAEAILLSLAAFALGLMIAYGLFVRRGSDQ
jgi:hypothetical protein